MRSVVDVISHKLLCLYVQKTRRRWAAPADCTLLVDIAAAECDIHETPSILTLAAHTLLFIRLTPSALSR